MLHRVLEPEVMDTVEEARDYDAMDHSTVNRPFVTDFLFAALDAGLPVGGDEPSRDSWPVSSTHLIWEPAPRIPIELCRRAPMSASWPSTWRPRCCNWRS